MHPIIFATSLSVGISSILRFGVPALLANAGDDEVDISVDDKYSKSAIQDIDNIIQAIAPIFRLAGVVMLAFFLIKFIVSLSNGDETQSKTTNIIMIIISIGLIFWESLTAPIRDAINAMT